MACCKGAPEEIAAHGSPDLNDWWSTAVSFNQEDQSDCIPYEILSLSEAGTYDCFLEELHQVCRISF